MASSSEPADPGRFRSVIWRCWWFVVFAGILWIHIGLAASTPQQETFLDKALIHPDQSRDVVSTPDIHTVRRMIGRMLVVGFRGSSVDNPEMHSLARQIENGYVGGVLVLPRNVSSAGEVRRLVRYFTDHSAHPGFVVAIDQEGGRIQRLDSRIGFPETASARGMARGDPVSAEHAYARMAATLAEWGFNLNLGPVVDLDLAPSSAIISRLGRSYSDDPLVVSEFASAFVRAHRSHQVGTALKHFPGHGSSSLDTHRRPVDISLTWTPAELEPYTILAGQGLVDAVMVGHLTLRTPGRPGPAMPASLDAEAIDNWLRPLTGQDVVVITDDLDMAAVRETHPALEAIEAAIRAGSDLIIHANTFDHDPMLASRAVERLAAMAMRDDVLLDRIVSANRRLDRAEWLHPRSRPGMPARAPGFPPE